MRCGSCAVSASASNASRSRCALSTTSSRLSGPFGASCARRPIRQRGGISTLPCSAERSPAITLNKRGLAGSIAAYQSDPCTRGNTRGGAFQQHATGNADSKIVNVEHDPRLLADRAVSTQPLGPLALADLAQAALPGFALIDDQIKAWRPVVTDSGR